MKKVIYSSLAVLMLLMASASLAQAGGWAVVTLDRLPGEVVAGQPLSVSFGVRQHGLTLMDGLTPKVSLSNRELGRTQRINASALSDKGHYQATFTPTAKGTWTWTIDAYGAFPQPMPPLHVISVAAPMQSVSAPAAGASGINLFQLVGWLTALLGVAGAVAMIAVWRRSGSHAAFALSIVAALVGMGGTAAAALPTGIPSAGSGTPGAAHAPSAVEEASLSPEQYGHDLYVAKGCVVCHAHAAFTNERNDMGMGSDSFGPVLTSIRLDSVYLHRWLKDPAAIKGAGVQMPTLGLSDPEIDGLVIFLTTYKEK